MTVQNLTQISSYNINQFRYPKRLRIAFCLMRRARALLCMIERLLTNVCISNIVESIFVFSLRATLRVQNNR